MNSFNKTTLLLILFLLATNTVWGIQYMSQRREIHQIKSELSAIAQNKKILSFQKLFIEKVLKANGEVDFNTRVELQNAVNDTKDESIIKTWNEFLAATSEFDGQNKVKDLLSLFATKTYSE